MARFFMVTSIPVLALLAAGCPRPVGGCSYSKNNVTTEQVTIKQISQQGDAMIVEVDSEIQPFFSLSKADYDQCIAAEGYAAGSSVTVSMMPGGSCPPMTRIAQCPWQS